MSKKIFPGGNERAKKIATKKQDAEKRAEFKKAIGPATRLLIARRGLTQLLLWWMVAVGFGTVIWDIENIADKELGREHISLVDAFINAHDVRNLFKVDKWVNKRAGSISSDASYTFMSMVLLFWICRFAKMRMKKDEEVAEKTLKYKDSMRYLFAETDFFRRYDDSDLAWKLHAVSRAVIRKIAADNPELFNRLLSGEINNATRDYAITVISGWLKNHPDDFAKVADVYDINSLPKSLVRKYAPRTR